MITLLLALAAAPADTTPPPAYTPLRSEHGSARITPLLAAWPREARACLVWFAQDSWDTLWPLDTLKTRARMEVVKVFRDGVVYLLNRRQML